MKHLSSSNHRNYEYDHPKIVRINIIAEKERIFCFEWIRIINLLSFYYLLEIPLEVAIEEGLTGCWTNPQEDQLDSGRQMIGDELVMNRATKQILVGQIDGRGNRLSPSRKPHYVLDSALNQTLDLTQPLT